MSAPLVPVRRVLRLSATGAVAGRSLLAASATWVLVLAAVYASDAGPPLPAMAVTAVLLFPVAAWAASAALAGGSADLTVSFDPAAGAAGDNVATLRLGSLAHAVLYAYGK